MIKQLNILFKLVVVSLLSIVLTNEESFAQNSFKCLEVLEYEIEEEEKVDILTADTSHQAEYKGNDGSKKHSNLKNSNSSYSPFIDEGELVNVIEYQVNRLNIPRYILYCSLIVYA